MHKKTIIQTSVFFTLVMFSLGLFGLDKLGWLDWLKRPVEIITNPVKRTIWGTFSNIKYQISNIKYQTENDPVILQEKLDLFDRQLALLSIENEELKKENEKMRHLLGAPLPASWHFLPAKVLGLKDQILAIDQGSDSKAEEGMAVLLAEEDVIGGVLLGKIVKANPRLSQVMLISHPRLQIAGRVLPTGAKGVVVGTLERKAVLEQVLQKENLAKGQLVVTTGEKEQFPPGLLLGKVEAIEKVETEIYQKAVLESLVDFQKLETVFIKL